MREIMTLVVCCLCVLVLGACGDSSIKVTGQNGAVYESYQEACTAQDFVAAHIFLDRMKAEASRIPDRKLEKRMAAENRVEEATEYITNREILLLMSLDDETAYDRITFLLKENDLSDYKNDEFCDKVIDLAIDMNKTDLVKRMTNFYKNRISSVMLEKIVENLYVKQGEENLDFVTSLVNQNGNNAILINAAIKKGNEMMVLDLAQKYEGTMRFNLFRNVMDYLEYQKYSQYGLVFEQLSTKVSDKEKLLDYAIQKNQKVIAKSLLVQKQVSIQNKELISKLASMNDKQFSDMVLSIVSEAAIKIPVRPSIPKYLKSDIYGDIDNTEHGLYNTAAKAFNEECKSLLNIAISNKNQYLANNIVLKIKPVFLFTNLGDWEDVVVKRGYSSIYDAYKVELSYEDINSAKQTLKQAVHNGSFR